MSGTNRPPSLRQALGELASPTQRELKRLAELKQQVNGQLKAQGELVKQHQDTVAEHEMAMRGKMAKINAAYVGDIAVPILVGQDDTHTLTDAVYDRRKKIAELQDTHQELIRKAQDTQGKHDLLLQQSSALQKQSAGVTQRGETIARTRDEARRIQNQLHIYDTRARLEGAPSPVFSPAWAGPDYTKD